MLDKFKELAKLKKLQDEVKKERFDAQMDGVSVTVNGAFNILEVVLNPELDTDKQAQTVKDVTNQALGNAQRAMAEKFKGMM